MRNREKEQNRVQKKVSKREKEKNKVQKKVARKGGAKRWPEKVRNRGEEQNKVQKKVRNRKEEKNRVQKKVARKGGAKRWRGKVAQKGGEPQKGQRKAIRGGKSERPRRRPSGSSKTQLLANRLSTAFPASASKLRSRRLIRPNPARHTC